MIEFNYFYEDPKRHVKLTAESVEVLAQLYMDFMAWNHETFEMIDPDDLPFEGYEDEPQTQPVTVATGPQEARQPSQRPAVANGARRPVQRPAAGAVKCGICGGAVYDEHKSNFWGNGLAKSGNAKPDWRCKDKDNCGGVAWDQYDKDNQYEGIGDWQHAKL